MIFGQQGRLATSGKLFSYLLQYHIYKNPPSQQFKHTTSWLLQPSRYLLKAQTTPRCMSSMLAQNATKTTYILTLPARQPQRTTLS